VQQRDTLNRRLQWRLQQRAHFGMLADPSIIIDIQIIERDLKQIETRIAQYSIDIATRADRSNLLTEAQQREAVLVLSRITGLPADKIKLIDIVIGSVVVIVEMPLAGAARLVAMQRLNHPMLRDQGFAHVALDRVVGPEDRPLDRMFERAVRFEQAQLESSTPPSAEASPYAGEDAVARLRITLAGDAVQR